MKLTVELRCLAMRLDCPEHVRPFLEEAAQKLEDQRLWREAWLNAESRVELLTRELDVLRSTLTTRKEKEKND
jgi:hypothetical protein